MCTKKPKKLLILNILDILNKYSDENHRLSQKDIEDKLETEYNMSVNRKTIKPNILDLIDAGYDINYTESMRGNVSVWTDFYINRDFTQEELRLITDSLIFSKYIGSGQCRRLVAKLANLSSIYFSDKTGHIQSMGDKDSREKANKLFYTISVLDEAIEKGLQVSFSYCNYSIKKKLVARKDEEGKDKKYVVSPYQMVVANSRYYLIGNMEKYNDVSHYRIERIQNIELTDKAIKPQSRLEGCEEGIDLPKHMAEHIYMFSGKSENVTFRAKKWVMNDIIDWFGRDIEISEEDEEHILVNVRVNQQAMLYWAMQYVDKVRVLGPESLVNSIKEELAKGLDSYRD